ncbi:MAG: hypothetical protein QNK04_16030 [Myxococcota bacterium]|nr:hypothetical protein [Myxococcota bacterium]
MRSLGRVLCWISPALALCLVAPDAPATGGVDPDLCAPAPQTGCFQSDAVRVRASVNPGHPHRDALHWSWKAGDPSAPADLGDPQQSTGYALCVYDGEATLQTETEAPARDTDSLVTSIDAPAGRGWWRFAHRYFYLNPFGSPDGLVFGTVRAGERGAVTLKGFGPGLDLAALEDVDTTRVISQVQNAAGGCWGAEISVELRNPPPYSFPGIESEDVIDEAKAEALLDELAALYNRKLGTAGPLDMTLWTNALGATEIQNQVATSAPADLDVQALTSALYVFGWYGGTLFQRDGFQGNPGPAGPQNPNPFAFANAVSLFREGTQVALTGSDQEVFDFLASIEPGGPGGTGTGVLASVETYGYNTGYGFAVLEDLIDVFQPPIDKLVCSGVTAYTPPGGPIHPKLPFVPADAPLFDCEFTPSFLEARPALRPLLDDYLEPGNPNVAALPPELQPAALKSAQDVIEGTGSFVWKVLLAGVIKQDQAYRESLWDVDNAFLEVVEAAALLGLGALARADADLGRQAVLAGGSVLEGWLASYSFGLTAPSGPEPYDPATDPRVLPVFDLGTTPLEPFQP